MMPSLRVLFFRVSYAMCIVLFVVIYPEPWVTLRVPIEVDFWPQGYAFFSGLWQWVAPLQPLVIALLLMAQWISWRKYRLEKEKIYQQKQERMAEYQQLEAQIYEGKPLFAKGIGTVEYKPLVDALYWQQQQLTALQHKQLQLDKHFARERELKAKLEQEKRRLSLSLLEIKETDKQRCEQIRHLKLCFADEVADLKERLNYFGALRSSTYQHWAQLLPQLIETCQYLYLDVNHPAHAMLVKQLKCQLEDELDALVSYFDVSPERAQSMRWQMPSMLSPLAQVAQQHHLVSTAQANQWQFMLVGNGLNSLFEQLVQQGFNAQFVADIASLLPQLQGAATQSKSICVVLDCNSSYLSGQGQQHQQDNLRVDYSELFNELDAVLPPDILLVAASQQWSWQGVHQYQMRVDGLLTYPISLFDLLRCLPVSSVPSDEDNLSQLEQLLQTQLPKEPDLTLLASNEEMQQKHILDTEQHLLPEVPQALFDLAEAAEALTKEQGVAQNSATLIRLSEQLALPMLAVVAKELVAQHQQNKDISALCIVLWQCYQESVRAFNARTEF